MHVLSSIIDTQHAYTPQPLINTQRQLTVQVTLISFCAEIWLVTMKVAGSIQQR